MRPGRAPDVRAPVTTELGLVAHATEGDAHELAAERRARPTRRATSCRRPEGPTSARIAPAPAAAPARRVDHAALGAQLAHRQVLDDAVLHVVETGVVGVEDRARVTDVELLVGARAPRDLEHGVEPGADPPVLGALLAGALEPVDLARRPRRARRRAARAPRACVAVLVDRRRRRRRSRPAPCGSRRAAGAAGTRAGSCPCRR